MEKLILDSEDFGDLLVMFEKSYHIKFGKEDNKPVKDFGELCDAIINKISGTQKDDCTSQQTFYKLRKVISDLSNNDTLIITPETRLEELFPRKNRRTKFKKIEMELGFKIKALRPKNYIIFTLVIFFLISLFSILIGIRYFSILSLVITIPSCALSIALMKIADKFGKEFSMETAGKLADEISRYNYMNARKDKKTINRNEIKKQIEKSMIEILCLEVEKIRKNTLIEFA